MMVFLYRDNGEVVLWQYTWVSSTSSLPVEDIEHFLTQCVGTSDTRKAKLPALLSFARQLDLAASNVHGNLQHAIFNLSWQLPGRAMQLATCNLHANLSFEQDWSCSVRLAGNLLATDIEQKNVWMSDKSWEPSSLSHSISFYILNNFCFHGSGVSRLKRLIHAAHVPGCIL